MTKEIFDFILVGGGPAGCALTRVLCQYGRTLLLERGRSMEEEPLTQTEAGWPAVLKGSATERQRVKGGGWALIGNVIGGGTSINAGIFLKEPDGEFFREHSHLIKSAVDLSYANISKVGFERNLPPICNTIVEGMVGSGIGEYHKSTSVSVNGVFAPYSLFDSRGVRHSAASLLPHKGEKGFHNLTVRTQSLACRILFSDKASSPRAIGVEYVDLKRDSKGLPLQVFLGSQGEVIVSAGAIHSPKLLMLSGIGDPLHLKALDIRLLLSNPDVGLHLMDQPICSVLVHCQKPVKKTVSDIAAVTDQIHFEEASGGEIVTLLGPLVGALLPQADRSEKNLGRLQRLFSLLSRRMQNGANQGIILTAVLKHPVTRGTVRLKSADPKAHLEIDSPKFLHGCEQEAMIGALKALRKFVESAPIKEARRDQSNTRSRFLMIQLARLYASLIDLPIARFCRNSAVTFPPLPDLDFEDHEEEKKNKAIQWLNMMSLEGWHYSGTCQFGKVVDEDFKVIGVRGLRVVDASVLKRPPTINPQATLMMLGDYAGRISIARPKGQADKAHA